MGRPRGFDEPEVVASAAATFVEHGYEGTSIDVLVAATGLHRGSLYKAFGSKRGIFLAALRRAVGEGAMTPAVLDLVLVAALELARDDREVRALVDDACRLLAADLDAAAELLGRRLLQRAGLTPTDLDPART